MIDGKVVGNLGLGTDLEVDNLEARTDTGVDLEVHIDTGLTLRYVLSLGLTLRNVLARRYVLSLRLPPRQ